MVNFRDADGAFVHLYGRLRHISNEQLQTALDHPLDFYEDFRKSRKDADDEAVMRMRAMMDHLKFDSTFKELYGQLQDLGGELRAQEITPAQFEERSKKLGDDFQGEIQSGLSRLKPPFDFPAPPADPSGIDLRESWHCLNYVLTGVVEPSSDQYNESPILGGHMLPDRVGVMRFGPMRYFKPDEVEAKAVFLAKFQITDALNRYNAAAATDLQIYRADHTADELKTFFDLLSNFYRECLKQKHAALLWLE